MDNDQFFNYFEKKMISIFTGYYMYIETSSPKVPGDSAKLTFSVPGNKQLSCLKFFYHMYGDTIETLTVFSGNSVVFEALGNHGNSWKEAKINIYLDYDVSFNKSHPLFHPPLNKP